MMPIGMTAQLAPVFWAMFTVLFISAVGIGVSAWRSREGLYRAVHLEDDHCVSDRGLSEAA
jgi:hypothetical protein